MYTAEQLARRNASPLTQAMMIIGAVQLVVLVLCFFFVLRFLRTGRGWIWAHITFWINIVLLWVNTAIGIVWEKQFYNEYFMCPQFFWEDVGNLAALLAYSFYFIGIWQNWSQRRLAACMLVASSVYAINFAQWIIKRMIV